MVRTDAYTGYCEPCHLRASCHKGLGLCRTARNLRVGNRAKHHRCCEAVDKEDDAAADIAVGAGGDVATRALAEQGVEGVVRVSAKTCKLLTCGIPVDEFGTEREIGADAAGSGLGDLLGPCRQSRLGVDHGSQQQLTSRSS